MKFAVLVAILCVFASAEAQVRCRNPGSLAIPVSPCCNQVAGRGLGGAVNNFFNLMDLECKVNMFFQAVLEDSDMLEFFNYVTGPEFRSLLLSVQNLQEFKDFMWYLCQNLDLDAYLYLNTLGDILGTPRIPHPIGPHCHPEFPFPWVSTESLNVGRKVSPKVLKKSSSRVGTSFCASGPGVRNFMDDLMAEIPNDDIYDMWLHSIVNDPYLCPGFLKLSSTEFRAIATKMEFHPEFIRFVDKLECWGIQMKQFMVDLKIFLWDSPYCR